MKAILILILTACALQAAPPRFAITKSTIDGGGDRTADGSGGNPTPPRFTLTGSIGQPDAGLKPVPTGSRFALQPGFWSEYGVVQVPDGPQLTIRKGAPGQVVLAWPLGKRAYLLQKSPDLSPNSWTTVAIAVVDTATEHTVTVPIDQPRMFFKLMSP